MVNPVHSDKVVEWCPYCREYHEGESEEALLDEIENTCKSLVEQ